MPTALLAGLFVPFTGRAGFGMATRRVQYRRSRGVLSFAGFACVLLVSSTVAGEAKDTSAVGTPDTTIWTEPSEPEVAIFPRHLLPRSMRDNDEWEITLRGDDAKRVLGKLRLSNGTNAVLWSQRCSARRKKGEPLSDDPARYYECLWLGVGERRIVLGYVNRWQYEDDGPIWEDREQRDHAWAEAPPSRLGLAYVQKNRARFLEIDLDRAFASESPQDALRDLTASGPAYVSVKFLPDKQQLPVQWPRTGSPPQFCRQHVHGMLYYDNLWHVDFSIRGRHFHMVCGSAHERWRILSTPFGRSPSGRDVRINGEPPNRSD